MTSILSTLVLLVGIGLLTSTGPAVAAPEAGATAAASSPSSTLGARGSFTSPCDYSHRLPDDPIVRPGRPGASHEHDFFGSRSTDAFSTAASLRASATSCERTRDTAAYWVPTLHHEGRAFPARQMRVYYRTGGLRDVRSLRSFPAGLRVVAGAGGATQPQPLTVTSWACTVRGGGTAGEEQDVQQVPATCHDEPLRLKVVFPSCWNGVDLDSADHQSHMAYLSRGRCPSSHPVAVPQLTLSLRYWVRGALDTVTLSSGGTYTAHADFLNSWHQPSLDRLVEICLRQGRSCGESAVPRSSPIRRLLGPARLR